MNDKGTELRAIKEIVGRYTRWFRTYDGEVIDDQDPKSMGRVKVSIPELNWLLPNECPWFSPEYWFGQITPAVGTYVEVYFKGGMLQYPMYRGRPGTMDANKPPSYEGPNTAVLLHDDGDDPLIIKWQRAEKILTIECKEYKHSIDMTEKVIETTLGEKLSFKYSEDGLNFTFDKLVLDTDGSGSLKLEMDKFSLETDGSTATIDANGAITINGNLEVAK
jgi:hypothetical protein